MENVDAVNAYFDAMRNKDAAAHRGLFTEDAQLVTTFGTFTGVDAIVAFYPATSHSQSTTCGPNPVLCSSAVIARSNYAPVATGRCHSWATSSRSETGRFRVSPSTWAHPTPTCNR